MIFLRLSAGFLLQVIPFAVLALYPYCEQLRFSKKRSILLTLWLLLGLSALFAAATCGSCFPRITRCFRRST